MPVFVKSETLKRSDELETLELEKMQKKSAYVLFLMLPVLLLPATFSSVYAKGCQGGQGGGGCGNIGSTAPLSETEKQYLKVAIGEEYFARAVYQKAVSVFGPISPFPEVIRDEQMHINMLANLHVKYGLAVPSDPWSGNIAQEFTSKQQACQVGAQAEINNAAAYNQMLSSKQITHNDIISTFTKLRDVSQYKHLPAFQYWANIYAGT